MRTIPPTIEITPNSPTFNGYYKALLEPEANILGKLLCEDLRLDTTGQPSHSNIQKVSLASRYQNHPEIIAYLFGTFHLPLLDQIDSPLLSPNLQYPNYPEKEELEPLSALLPFWKQEEIDTPNWDTNLGLAALRLRHMLNSLMNQLPHLTPRENRHEAD
jgi:hypothetical protein